MYHYSDKSVERFLILFEETALKLLAVSDPKNTKLKDII